MSSTRLARQRRPEWIAVGVILMAFAVLANVQLVRSSSAREPVVRLARDVPVGQQVVHADLDVARVAVDSAVPVIPDRQLSEVVGRRASIGLRKGTLLAASQLTVQQSPQPGQALVTVPVKAGALPPGLGPGWRLRIVFTSGDQNPSPAGGQDRTPGTALPDVEAVVDQVKEPDAEGSVTVSLLVTDSQSSTVARQAATGTIVLVVTERRD